MPAKPKNAIQAKQNIANSNSRSVTHSGRPSTDKSISTRDSRPLVVTVKVGETVRSLLLPESLPGLERAFGTNDRNSLSALLEQVHATLPDAKQDLVHWNYVLATLHDIGPKDTIEGLLAVQMVSVHELAMEFLARAIRQGQSSEATDGNVNRANKLLRTFIAQLEALNRHRGKTPQPMVVGNVNIADGGQAIVGPVNHLGPGTDAKHDEKRVG
jgi:hypothetical protein